MTITLVLAGLYLLVLGVTLRFVHNGTRWNEDD